MTPARQAEADRVELVYYWALNQLGNAMAVDALDLWSEVPATQQAARSSWWLAELLRLLFGFRREVHDLAIAYYRLVRALRTGTTVAYGDEQDGDLTSLEDLRQDFEAVVDEIARETTGQAEAPTVTIDLGAEPDLEPGDGNDVIEIEDVLDIDALIDEQNDAAEDEATTVLDALGIQNLIDKLGELPDDADQQAADDAHADAGNRQASAAMRIMLNASRGLVYDLADTDLRVIGWVRYSRTGTPCGWCAMLISRGVVYKTRAQAGGVLANGETKTGEASGDQDKYHDNCRCMAVPIFGLEQYDGSPLFDQNRDYQALWNERIKGKFKGKAALTEWRRIIRALAREQDTAAPEAA